MSIYWVGTKGCIYSTKEWKRKEDSDEPFIAAFLRMQELILKSHHESHEELNTLAREFSDLNAIYCSKERERWTLMHQVAKKGCHLCGEILMLYGANPDLSVKYIKKTPRELALEKGHEKLSEVIYFAKPPPNVEITYCSTKCSLKEDVKTTRRLLEASHYESVRLYSASYEGFLIFGPGKEERTKLIVGVELHNACAPKSITLNLVIEKKIVKDKPVYRLHYNGECDDVAHINFSQPTPKSLPLALFNKL